MKGAQLFIGSSIRLNAQLSFYQKQKHHDDIILLVFAFPCLECWSISLITFSILHECDRTFQLSVENIRSSSIRKEILLKLSDMTQ